VANQANRWSTQIASLQLLLGALEQRGAGAMREHVLRFIKGVLEAAAPKKEIASRD